MSYKTTITYNGNQISQYTGEATKTLNCANKYMNGNVVISVEEYTPSVPLTFTANTAGSTVTLTKTGSPSWTGYYSTNDGTTWTSYTPGTTGAITLANVGDTVCFKGTLTSAGSNRYLKFTMTGSIAGSGNIMSLCSGDDYETTTTLPCSDCFYSLFSGCSSLTSAPELPATTLTNFCYYYMFYNCTNLKIAPNLPATSLNLTCYSNMFRQCESLIAIPALRAKNLINYCYSDMFYGCTALKFSETQTTECSNAYRIPTTENGVEATDWNTNMFIGTSGSFTSNPAINTTYYTNATIINNLPNVGGRIFYIDSSASGATYKFYDISMNEITGWSTIDDLEDAYYYEKTGTGSADKFYVADSTNCMRKYDGTNACVWVEGKNELLDSYSSSIEVLSSASDSVIGKGKTNTAWFLANRYNSYYYPAHNSVSGRVTCWDFAKTCNDNSVNGCNDWFVPNIAEITALRNSGIWGSTLAEWVNTTKYGSNTYSYLWSSSASPGFYYSWNWSASPSISSDCGYSDLRYYQNSYYQYYLLAVTRSF